MYFFSPSYFRIPVNFWISFCSVCLFFFICLFVFYSRGNWSRLWRRASFPAPVLNLIWTQRFVKHFHWEKQVTHLCARESARVWREKAHYHPASLLYSVFVLCSRSSHYPADSPPGKQTTTDILGKSLKGRVQVFLKSASFRYWHIVNTPRLSFLMNRPGGKNNHLFRVRKTCSRNFAKALTDILHRHLTSMRYSD